MQYPFHSTPLRAILSTLALATLAACGGGGGGGSAGALSGATLAANGSAASGGGTSASGAAASLRGSDFAVNTATAGDQYGAQVARLAGGGFVVAWSSIGTGATSEVRLQRFDASGQPSGSEQLVAGHGSNAQVTALADGGFLVTWNLSPYIYTVLSQGQRFDAQGAAVGAAVELGNGFNNSVGRPMALPDGSYLFVASVNQGRYLETFTRVQHHAADGTLMGTPTELHGDLMAQASAYDMNYAGGGTSAVLEDGRIAVAWVAYGDAGNELRLNLFDAQANPLGASRTIAAGPGVENPSLVARPGGGFVVAWEGGLQQQDRSAFVEAFDAAGTSLGPTRLFSDPAASYVTPLLARLDDGTLVASWRTVRYGASSAERRAWALRLDGNASAMGGAEVLPDMDNPLGATGGTHALTSAGGSDYLVVYDRWSASTGSDVRATLR